MRLGRRLRRSGRPANERLTAPELWVLAELARGQHPKEIARDRKVTVTAISKICRRAKAKLGARTTYQAVLFFVLDYARETFKP